MRIDWQVAAKLLGIAVAALIGLSLLPDLLRAPAPPPLDPRVGLLPAPEPASAVATKPASEVKKKPPPIKKPRHSRRPPRRLKPAAAPEQRSKEPPPERRAARSLRPERDPEPTPIPAPPPAPPAPAAAPVPAVPPPPPADPTTAVEQEFGP